MISTAIAVEITPSPRSSVASRWTKWIVKARTAT